MCKRISKFLALMAAMVILSSSLAIYADDRIEGYYYAKSCTVEKQETTIPGIYMTHLTRGCAVLTTKDSIRTLCNVPKYTGQEPFIKVVDTDSKNSTQAIAVINQAANELGVEVGPMLNIELGVIKDRTEFSYLEGGPIRLIVGTPGSFMDRSKNYAMLCVREGGAISIYPDVDDNPWSVTFDTTGGAGTYAIIRY